MPIEGFDTCQKLSIITARYQDLGACADSGLENGERAGSQFVLFDLSNFILAVFVMVSKDCV